MKEAVENVTIEMPWTLPVRKDRTVHPEEICAELKRHFGNLMIAEFTETQNRFDSRKRISIKIEGWPIIE